MFELRIHATIREIPEEAWNALDGVSEAPFLSWAFFDVLEQTGCVKPFGGAEAEPGEKGRSLQRTAAGWMPHYLTLHQGEALVAAAPAFLKGNSEGEFVFDHAWANAAYRAGIEYFPKLVVAVPFTPATAPRLLVAPGADFKKVAAAMAEGLRQLVSRMEISSAHVLFPTEEQAAELSGAGLAERYGLQFHWKNAGYTTYDDFLARFSSKRRNQWRRERREMAAQGIELVTLRGREITPDLVDAMYSYYTATVDKFAWGRRYLNRGFFEEIVPRLGDGVEVVLAREGKKPIAGAFNFAGRDALYGRYWGATEERPFLHFNVCFYHSIEQCILRKIGRFEPGAGGEHKMSRGFEPTITRSLHHVADPRLDAAIREYLVREREALAREVDNPEMAFR